MDSSTTRQCRALEAEVGAKELRRITGSRAYERFTGPQIAKAFAESPETYAQTERISLVSSFLCSVLLGRYAPIDHSDASGCNLFDINTSDWSEPCLQACAPGLRAKLGPAAPAGTPLGPVAPFYVERYGFSETCQ